MLESAGIVIALVALLINIVVIAEAVRRGL